MSVGAPRVGTPWSRVSPLLGQTLPAARRSESVPPRAIVAAAPLAAAAALLVVPAATGGEGAVRLIDRTVVCAMPGEGFPDVTRLMTVSAVVRPPWITVSNGPSYELRAAVRTRGSGRERTGAASLHREACTATSRRVRLGARGLGLSVRRAAKCDVPVRVLVRIRAWFTRPTGWVRDGRSGSIVHARGTVTSGSLTVTTLAGRPVAHADVDDARRRARLFVSRSSCATS